MGYRPRRHLLAGSLVAASVVATLFSGIPVAAAPADPVTSPEAKSGTAHTMVSDSGETVNAASVLANPEVQGGKRRGFSPASSGTEERREEAGGAAPTGKGPSIDTSVARPDPAQGVSGRPDIAADEGELSEEDGAETIIGADNRVRIYGTTSYPYRAVVLITGNMGNSSFRCTGWLINANTVATAGHCLYNGAWATNVRVYPGYTGSSAPYGSCSARRLYSVTGWVPSRNSDYDYGAIKLNCNIGNTTGYFGFRWTSASLTNQSTIIAGYPGDKPYTLWASYDRVRVTGVRQLFYANDTTGGMSGSPVYNYTSSCSGPCGIAIHTNGVYGGSPYNRGTRITQQVYNNLLYWRNLP